jgi:hypothetical protein
MKAKAMQPQREGGDAENESVRAEMRMFLEALGSYPERFAANPGLTFEEHRARLTAQARAAPIFNGVSKTRES